MGQHWSTSRTSISSPRIFLKFLKKLPFTRDVWALPEVRLFFKDEPVLQVTAPIIEAQLVEKFISNQSTYSR